MTQSFERHNGSADDGHAPSKYAADALEGLNGVFEESGIHFPKHSQSSSERRSVQIDVLQNTNVISVSANQSVHDGKQMGVIELGFVTVTRESLEHNAVRHHEYSLKRLNNGQVFGYYSLIAAGDGRDMMHPDLVNFHADMQMLKYLLSLKTATKND